MSRRIILIFLILALLGTGGLCALSGYGLYRWLGSNQAHVRIFSFEDVSAEASETRTFPSTGIQTLEVDTDFGAIDVASGEGDEIQVEIHKKAWGANADEARQALDALQVDITQTSTSLALRYDQPDKIVLAGSVEADTVSFTIRAPAHLAVRLHTDSGDVTLSDMDGAAQLEVSFGSITARDLDGALNVNSGNARLHLENVQAGSANIQLETTFGNVEVNGLSGGAISIRTANAELNLNGVQAGASLEIENKFGKIDLQDFSAASVEIINANGDLILENGQVAETLQASTTFGDVLVSQVQADGYALTTTNGTLDLDGASGHLTLMNEFGDIHISAASQAVLEVQSSNGSIDFSGSLDASAAQRVENQFGSITLALPAESAFDLYLETEFGKISSELPVSTTGELSDEAWEATLNDGGPLITLTTQNGDIAIRELPAPP